MHNNILVVTDERFSWVAFQLINQLKKKKCHFDLLILPVGGAREFFEKKLSSQHWSKVIIVTVHSIHAIGGAVYLERIADRGIDINVWNVDSASLVHKNLPKHPSIKIIHVCESDCVFWNEFIYPKGQTDWTLGIGCHDIKDELVKPVLDTESRKYPLLVPMNLRWCSRSYKDIEIEVETSGVWVKQAFNFIFSSIYDDVNANIGELIQCYIHSTGNTPQYPSETLSLFRFLTYSCQLWRREWLIKELLKYPVLIDTNEIPKHLMPTKLLNIKATIINDCNPKKTLENTRHARAVLSTSFSFDLLHDRPLNAVLLGTLGFCENSNIYKKWFGENNGLIYYDFNSQAFDDSMKWLSQSTREVGEVSIPSKMKILSGEVDFRFERLLL